MSLTPEMNPPPALPQVEPPSLEGLSVTMPAPAGFTAEEVQQRFLELARPLAHERERGATEQVAWGDEVLLSIAGYIDGRLIPFSVRHQEWVKLEPEPTLPGLYEALVGYPPNKEGGAVDIVLPETYPVEALRGASARFLVAIHAAREVKYPDLESPQFLQAFGRGATLEAATRDVAEQLKRERAQTLVYEAGQRVLEEVASRTQVRVPDALIDEEIRLSWEKSEGAAVRALEFSEEETEQSLRAWLQDARTREQVELRLRVGLALGAICQRDGLVLTPELLEEFLAEQATHLGSSPEALAQSLSQEPQHMATIGQHAWHLLAVSHVLGQAKIHFERA